MSLSRRLREAIALERAVRTAGPLTARERVNGLLDELDHVEGRAHAPASAKAKALAVPTTTAPTAYPAPAEDTPPAQPDDEDLRKVIREEIFKAADNAAFYAEGCESGALYKLAQETRP